jgi:hypothetical protein
MPTYTYSIADDTLDGTASAGLLADEVDADAGVPNQNNVHVDVAPGDDIIVSFASALSGAEETALTAVVAAHDNQPPVPTDADAGIYRKKLTTQRTTTNATWTDVTGLNVANIPIRAGDAVLVSLSAHMSQTSTHSFHLDIAHNNSGSYVRLGEDEGLVSHDKTGPVHISCIVLLPKKTTTTFKVQMKSSSSGQQVAVEAASTTRRAELAIKILG